jgi:hypothetical protein
VEQARQRQHRLGLFRMLLQGCIDVPACRFLLSSLLQQQPQHAVRLGVVG